MNYIHKLQCFWTSKAAFFVEYTGAAQGSLCDVINLCVQSETRLQQKKIGDLELEIKKLSGQQNLQQRIKHHAKIKVPIHDKARCFQNLSV